MLTEYDVKEFNASRCCYQETEVMTLETAGDLSPRKHLSTTALLATAWDSVFCLAALLAMAWDSVFCLGVILKTPFDNGIASHGLGVQFYGT